MCKQACDRKARRKAVETTTITRSAAKRRETSQQSSIDKFERYTSNLRTQLMRKHVRDIRLGTREVNVLSYSHTFVVARLLGMLALNQREGSPLCFRINGDLAQYDPTDIYWRFFTESLAGIVLTHYADRIRDRYSHDCLSIIREHQNEILRRTSGLIGNDQEVAVPVIDTSDFPSVSQLVLSNDARHVTNGLKEILYDRLGLPRLDTCQIDGVIGSVREFVFETYQNTREHGDRTLEGQPVPSVAKFVWVRKLSPQRLLNGGLDNSHSTPASSYFNSLLKGLDPAPAEPRYLVEITISDAGPGIPATMKGSTKIYEEASPEEERMFLLAALEPTGTSKSIEGAGLGLYKVMRSARELRALVIFQTGRSYMYKNYLANQAESSSFQLDVWDGALHRIVAGTTLSIIFPWMESCLLPWVAPKE
jgi:hypothetical protein